MWALLPMTSANSPQVGEMGRACVVKALAAINKKHPEANVRAAWTNTEFFGGALTEIFGDLKYPAIGLKFKRAGDVEAKAFPLSNFSDFSFATDKEMSDGEVGFWCCIYTFISLCFARDAPF